jgi:ArsR family transcriptional regulator
MFRAFSDRTRLRILHLLGDGEICVGDLVKILRMPQPTVSRHLAYLRRAGLVASRREGQWAFYSLAAARRSFHVALLACLGRCFREVPELAEDTKRHRRIRRQGGCCP